MEKHTMKMNIAHDRSVDVPTTRSMFLFLPGKWKTHCPDRVWCLCSQNKHSSSHKSKCNKKQEGRLSDGMRLLFAHSCKLNLLKRWTQQLQRQRDKL